MLFRIGLAPLVLCGAALGPAGCAQDIFTAPVAFPSACPADAELPPQLFDPAPGATGVPDGLGRLLVGSPADGTFVIQAGTAAAVAAGAATAAPMPYPSDVPTGDTPHDVAIPALAPATTYTVTYDVDAPHEGCANETGGVIGSFTTQ